MRGNRRHAAVDLAPLVLLLGLAAPLAALAKPPPGADLNSPEHAWWQCQRQPGTRQICCDISDGHNLSDQDWRMVGHKDGRVLTSDYNDEPGADVGYQVRVGGRWYDVPPGKVLAQARNCGPEPDLATRADAKVWYDPDINMYGKITSIVIYCFMPGTEY